MMGKLHINVMAMVNSLRFFLKKILLIILTFLGILLVIEILSFTKLPGRYLGYFTDSYELLHTGPDEIVPHIKQVGTPDGTQTLICGDSVCGQLFNDLKDINPTICIAASNGGISPAGQYIIVKEYLEHHPDAKEVYLFILPVSLMRAYDTDYGYQYAVAPFVETDTLKYLDDDTINLIKKTYGKLSVNPTFERFIDNSGINKKLYLNYLKEYKTPYSPTDIFELGELYVSKIQQLCEERGVDFYLIASPVSDRFLEESTGWKEAYDKTSLKELFPDYFDNILFFPDEESVDGTHFGGDYSTRACYNTKVRKLIFETPLFDEINLGE